MVQAIEALKRQPALKGKKVVQAALDHVEERLAARPIGRQEWSDVLFMLSVIKQHDDDGRSAR